MNATIYFTDGTAPLTYEIFVSKETKRTYLGILPNGPDLVSFYGDLKNTDETGFFCAGKDLFIPVRRIYEIRIEQDDTIHKISHRTFNQI